MTAPAFGELSQDKRGEFLRLRTLTTIRIIAIIGQCAALLVAYMVFDLRFDLGLSALVVAAAGASVLIALTLFPQTKRLSDTEAMLTFLFDIAQLVCLLYLTGGITNPFSLLILAPVAVSASALQIRATLIVAGVAISLVSLISLHYRPLQFADTSLLAVHPIIAFGTWAAIVVGIAFQAFYAHRIARESSSMADALLAAQMALSREQKLTDLGGVVAAAAHELGTPLATIKLISSELAQELQDDPDLLEDVQILSQEADRCRDILHSMGRAGKDDLHLRRAPVSAVIEEAAEPHLARGKDVEITLESVGTPPTILRRPEVIHGLRNLIQNAVDFAQSRVTVMVSWDETVLRIVVQDDGPGFPAQTLASIGEPFLGRRYDPARSKLRPEYKGMGLGLFIAKTLLERSGARLECGNGPKGGARATLVWPMARIAADRSQALPQNRPVEG